jgi:hypothetical protein
MPRHDARIVDLFLRTFGLLPAALFAVAAAPQPAATVAGHPDMSGVYMMRGGQPASTPYQLTEQGRAIQARNLKAIADGDPEIDTALKCLPTGFPRMLFGPLPFYFLQTPRAVGVVAETDPLARLIYLDAEHRRDYWPTYMGDSVGHWEGDTLLIDTVKLVDTTFADIKGLPHSDALHVVERIRLINDGRTMENVVLIEDPKVFVKPWTITYLYDRRDDLKPVENVCENTRDRP